MSSRSKMHYQRMMKKKKKIERKKDFEFKVRKSTNL